MTFITTAGFLGHPFGCPFLCFFRYPSDIRKMLSGYQKNALRKCSTGIYIKHPSGMPVDRVFEGAVARCRAARQAFHFAKTLHGSACLRCSCICSGRFYAMQHIVAKIAQNMLYNISENLRMS